MESPFLKFLDNVSIWIVFAPFLAGLFLFNYLGKDSKIIWLVVIAASAAQLIHAVKDLKTFENVGYNVYTVIEFLLWFIIFKNRYSLKKSKIIFNSSVGIYLFFSLFLIKAFPFTQHFISEWVCLNNLIFTFWILFFIVEQFYTDEINFSFKNSFTWYITFELLYSSCTFLVFAFWYYRNEIPVLKNIQILHNIFNISLYVGFCGGFFIDYLSKNAVINQNERQSI